MRPMELLTTHKTTNSAHWNTMLLGTPYSTPRSLNRRKVPPLPVEFDRRIQDRRRGALHLHGPSKMPPEIKMAA